MRDNNIAKKLDNATVKNSEIQNLIPIQNTNSHILSCTKIKIVKNKHPFTPQINYIQTNFIKQFVILSPTQHITLYNIIL